MATNNNINLNAQGLAYYDGAGTFSAPTATQHSLIIGSTNNDVASLGVATDGQLPIGSTGADPVLATLTAGTGVSITNGAGSITIAATGSGSITWNDVTGTTQTMAANNGYLADNSALVTLTLPTTCAQFDIIAVAGNGAGGWTIAQNASQSIVLGSVASTTGTGGSVSSTNQYDCIYLLCTVANDKFLALNSVGNLTIV